jgi:hypothetical protein
MGELIGGLAFFYTLLALLLAEWAKRRGCTYSGALFAWMLLTGWTGYGLFAGLVFAILCRRGGRGPQE